MMLSSLPSRYPWLAVLHLKLINFVTLCALYMLRRQVWNDEPIVDRYLGCIDLPIEIFVDVRTFGGGRRQWFPLDSEGALECTFHAPLPPF